MVSNGLFQSGFQDSRQSKGAVKYNTERWWMGAVRNAIEMRERHSKQSRWRDIEDYWNHEGDEFAQGNPAFNTVYMYGRSLIPSVTFKRPVIINTARPKFDSREQSFLQPMASIYDSIDALLMDEMEAEDIFKDSVLYAYLYNMAPVEVGYDFPGLPDINSEDFLRQQQLAQAGFTSKEGIHDRARRSNYPWLDLISPWQFIIDPIQRMQRRMRWYAKAVYVPTRILKKDSSLNQKNVKPTHIPEELTDSVLNSLMEAQGGLEDYTLVYEIHEVEEGTFCWMTAENKLLFDPEPDPMQLDGLPIEMLTFNRNPKSIWGTPDALYIEPQMLDGNETRKLGLWQRRIALTKFLIDESMMDEDEIEKMFDEGIPALQLKNIDPGKSVRDGVAILQPHVQGEFLPYQESLVRDSDRMLGVGDLKRGNTSGGRPTKFEIQEVAFNAELRTDERRYLASIMIGNVFRKVNQAVTKYWTQEILTRVIGADGMRYFVSVRPSDLKTEMQTKVDVATLTPRSRERDREEMIQIAQILATVPNINILPLIRQIVSKFEWADVDAYLPQAQQDQPFTVDQFAQQQAGLVQGQGQQLGQQAVNNLTPLLAQGGAINGAGR